MVLIFRDSSKRVAPLPPDLQERVNHLVNAKDNEIKNWTDFKWNYPKGDLFQYVKVLNRFEAIMMDIGRKLGTNDGVQTAECTRETKQLILAMIRFGLTLYQNCVNRGIFSDTEFLDLLLNSTDIDIVEATSVLIMHIAIRARLSLLRDYKIIKQLATSWTAAELLSEADPNNTITMTFYKTENESAEGLHSINETITPGEYSDNDLFWRIVDKYGVSTTYHHELLNKVRIANAGKNQALKHKLLTIRLNAISILACVQDDRRINFTAPTYEPDLLTQLVTLISDESEKHPVSVQAYTLYALANLLKYRASDVFAALHASTHHDVLIPILRRMCQNSEHYTVEFVRGFYFLVFSFLYPRVNGTHLLLSGGMIPQLLQVLDHPEHTGEIYTIVSTKAIDLLGLAPARSQSAGSIVFSMKTFKKLLKSMEAHMDVCIKDHASGQTARRHSLHFIKRSFRFTELFMNTEHNEGLLNIMDTDFPHIVKKLWDNHKAFTPGIFGSYISLITSFIHIEPTSLSVLLELQIPQTLLKNFNACEQPSFKLLKNAMINFDAICLNSEGQRIFNESDPLPQFFRMMTSKSFVDSTKGDRQLGNLGRCVEEFLRHHPQHEIRVFQLLNDEIKRVVEIGNTESSKPEDNRHKLHLRSKTEKYDRTKSACYILDHISLIAQFLRGFLRNDKYIEEFIQSSGMENLLKYYDLQYLPYNYLQSNAFRDLHTVLRILSGKSPVPLTKLIIEKVYEYSRFIHTDLEYDSAVYIKHVNFTGENEEGNECLHKLSVLLGYCSLLSIAFVPSFSRFQDVMPDIIELAIAPNEKYGNAIMLFGEIHRIMLYQHLLLRTNVPEFDGNKFFGSYLDLSLFISTDYEYYRINMRRFHILLTEITSSFMPVIQNIIMNSLTHRSSVPPTVQKCVAAKKVANELAIMLKKSFRYIEQNEKEELKWDHTTFGYYAAMSSMIAILLQDDRDSTVLITPLLVAFEDNDLIQYLINELYTQTWLRIMRMTIGPHYDRSLLKKIHTFLEILLSVFYYFGNAKAIHESPHSLLLTTCANGHERRHGNPVNLYGFMATMQVKLSFLATLMQLENVLEHFSQHGIHLLLKCVRQNLEGEMELSEHMAFVQQAKNIPFYLTNRRALVSLGYQDSRVDEALTETRHGICALHWLFKEDLEMLNGQPYPFDFEISPELVYSSPLTPEELSDGVEIFVKLGYNATLSKELLQKHNNLLVAFNALKAMRSSTQATNEQNNKPKDDDKEVKQGTEKETKKTDTDSDDEKNPLQLGGSRYDDKEDPNIGNKDPLHYIYKKEASLCDEEDSRHSNMMRQNLVIHRDMIREQTPPILAKLVDSRDDIDFDVRDLIIALCRGGNNESFAARLTKVIRLFTADDDKGKLNDPRVSFAFAINKIRIFALMLREPSMQEVTSVVLALISNMMDWFSFLEIVIQQPDFSEPKWITTLFFVLETALAQSDEPKKESNPDDTSEEADSAVSTPSIVTPENRATLLKYCVDLLKVKGLPQDNVVATLRIIVRLTKHHEAALKFVELGGLEQLLWRPKSRFNILKIQQVYIIMILRHIIETKAVVSECMRKQLMSWARTSAEAKQHNNATYMTINNEGLVLRDPESFVQVSSTICRLRPDLNYSVRFLRKESVEAASDSNFQKSCSHDIMHYLLDQLEQVLEEQEQAIIDYAFTAFLIQCIFELVCSYPSCKYDIFNYKLSMARDITDVKQNFVYKLMGKLMDYNECATSNDKDKIKKGLAKWTTALFVVMCFEPAEKNSNTSGLLDDVRNTVLDAIYQKLQDQLTSDSIPSSKYAQYFAFSELLYSILIAKAAIELPIVKGWITLDAINTMAKLMLKKKFVPLLMSVAHDVDVNYPFARLILNSIMRPLEQLTRIAGITEKPNDQNSFNQQKKYQEMKYLIYVDLSSRDKVDDEVDDLYRSSSLFDGNTTHNDETIEPVNFDIIAQSRGARQQVAQASTADNNSERGEDEEEPQASDVSVGSLTYDDYYRSDGETVVSTNSEIGNSLQNRENIYRFDDTADGGQYVPKKGANRIYRQFLRAEITSDLDDNYMDARPDDDRDFLILKHFDSATGLIENPQILKDNVRNNTSHSNELLLHPLLKSTSTSPNASKARSLLFKVYLAHLKFYEHVLGIKITRQLKYSIDQKQESSARHPESWIDFNETPDPFDSYFIEYKENRETLGQIKHFEPLKTVARWVQEVQMVFTPSAATTAAQNAASTLLTRLEEIRDEEGEEKNDQDIYDDLHSTSGSSNASVSEHDNRSRRSSANSFVPPQMIDYNFEAAPDFVFYESVEEDSEDELGDSNPPLDVDNEDNNASDESDIDDKAPKPETGIDNEFLAALPEDVRADLLNKNAGKQESTADADEAEAFSPEFLQVLPQNMREEILQKESNRRHSRDIGVDNDDVHEKLAELNISRRDPDQQQVDTKQLAVLLRFIFTPESVAKPLLCKSLLNACKDDYMFENLLTMLLLVLKSESSDLDAVDRCLGIYDKKQIETDNTTEDNSEAIMQSCLGMIDQIIKSDCRSTMYFVTPNDKLEYRFPLVTLFTLLEKPVFANNPRLLDELMTLIRVMFKRIPDVTLAEGYGRNDPPTVPAKLILKVINLISARECSGSLFKNIVAILAQASISVNMHEIIEKSLNQAARRLAKLIMIDLDNMDKAISASEIDRSILGQFSSSNSNQAGLLRVLETIEFLYTCSLNPSGQTKNKNRVSLLYIYHDIELDDMWMKLSKTLTNLEADKSLSHTTSVFLPLIEALMIVSKFTLTNKGNVEGEATSNEGLMFKRFVEDHKDIVNSFLRNNPSLLGGSFGVMMRLPRLIDFQVKRKFFYEKLHAHTKKENHQTYVLPMFIRRDHVFEDSFDELRIADNEIKDVIYAIEFEGEEGEDAGGLTREWLTILSREIFDANNALFVEADKSTYQPNRASGVNSEHLRYFKFVGLVIAKAIYDKMALDVHFTRSFYKHVLKKPVDYRDMEAIDPPYFKSLVWMLENDITDIMDLTFSVDTKDFGENKEVELKENGSNIIVTEENKQEYVTLVANKKLYLDIKDQIEHFLQGFYCIIPANLIAIFNEQELELLISGLPDIEIDDWIANTVYEGYTANSPQIKWFWRAVRSFSNEERVKLLQFSTGTARVPLDGFAELQGSNGVQKFQIHKDFGDVKRLPSAHTCFNQIDLPEYPTYKDLRANLFKAISECTTGFAFA